MERFLQVLRGKWPRPLFLLRVGIVSVSGRSKSQTLLLSDIARKLILET